MAHRPRPKGRTATHAAKWPHRDTPRAQCRAASPEQPNRDAHAQCRAASPEQPHPRRPQRPKGRTATTPAPNVGLLPRSSRTATPPATKWPHRDAHPARSAKSPIGAHLRLAPLKGARSPPQSGVNSTPKEKRSASAEPHTATPPAQGARLTLSISQYALPTPGCGPYGGSCPGPPSRCAAKAAWRLRAPPRRNHRRRGGCSVEHPYKSYPSKRIYQPIASLVGLPPGAAAPRRCPRPKSCPSFIFLWRKFWQITTNH